MSEISDVLGFLEGKREKILPEYTRNGKPVYTLRNYASMTDLDAEVLMNGGVENLAQKVPSVGIRGNLLHTPRVSYAVNPEIAFDNRVKVSIIDNDGVEEKVYIFVVDQRAIMEQRTGNIYANHVVGYVVGRDKKGKLSVKGTVNIKEDEFLNDFDSHFAYEPMQKVMDLINKYKLEHGVAQVIDKFDF